MPLKGFSKARVIMINIGRVLWLISSEKYDATEYDASVAIAAPMAPYLGIRYKLSSTFDIAPNP